MTDKLKILCIEDNPVNWRLVQRLLSQAGYDMHWAEEGLQGYQMAVELKPALVLLDINLPGLSGFEVATKLRQNQELNSIPIVALTAKTMKSDRETALVAGCDGYISKPIDPFQFTAQVEAYLGGQREKVEQGREGQVLRQFSQQVVEHLESRLKESQDANRKLQEAQEALEIRNRNLSRLLSLSQSIVAEHDPKPLLSRILARAQEDMNLQMMHAFQVRADGGYFDGLRWTTDGFEPTQSLRGDLPLFHRLKGLMAEGPMYGERLLQSSMWEMGLEQGLWTQPSEAFLLPLVSREKDGQLWGFWAVCRNTGLPFQPFEAELLALQGGMAQVSLQNAELILSLSESSRALASSYENLESAYLEVQTAHATLSLRERQALLGDLFLKMTQWLQAPVAILHDQSAALEKHLAPKDAGTEWPNAVTEIRRSVAQIDSLVKALTRRAGKGESGTPEWIDLGVLLAQEMELLAMEGQVGKGPLDIAIMAATAMIFGIYGDFAETLSLMMGHSVSGSPSTHLALKAFVLDEHFHLEIQDEGGPIPETSLSHAFEPFTGLRQDASLGVRLPGPGLPSCMQLMASYQGVLDLRNEGNGTLLSLKVPLGQGA